MKNICELTFLSLSWFSKAVMNLNQFVKIFVVAALFILNVGCVKTLTAQDDRLASEAIQNKVTETPPTIIYLVRHAEKRADQGKDPSLTAAGKASAMNLAAVLRDVDLTAIYSTPYKRTIETATPTAFSQQLNLTVEFEPAEKFAKTLLNDHKGQATLVVGHSNTTPELIRALGWTDTVYIEHGQYGDLFIVEVERGSTKLKVSSF